MVKFIFVASQVGICHVNLSEKGGRVHSQQGAASQPVIKNKARSHVSFWLSFSSQIFTFQLSVDSPSLWRPHGLHLQLRFMFNGQSRVAGTWNTEEPRQVIDGDLEKCFLAVFLNSPSLQQPFSLSAVLSLSVQEGVLTNRRLWESLSGLQG